MGSSGKSLMGFCICSNICLLSFHIHDFLLAIAGLPPTGAVDLAPLFNPALGVNMDLAHSI